MKLLIGSTGTVGMTLKDSIQFDYEFNSKNIDQLKELDFSNSLPDLYLCCLPATKWKINQDPLADFNNMSSIVKNLSSHRYGNIVLYSTIDVYQDTIEGVDEATYPITKSLNYGSIRLIFEEFVKNTLKYNNLLILRLPAVYGKHIKKNIIYDLLNNNQVDKIVANSKYQWYNLQNLATDTTHELNRTQGIRITNLFPEPLNTSEILDLLKIDNQVVDTVTQGVNYNCKTIHNSRGYTQDKQASIQEIYNFISQTALDNDQVKISVCIFGEERDLANRISGWKSFQQKTGANFYVALYANDNINQTLKLLKQELKIKDYTILFNDLDKFDNLKYSFKNPVYIYTTDQKATFARITSQLYIREQALKLIKEDCDVVLLCRSDVSHFNISPRDIWNVYKNEELLVVPNSEEHGHPGGGGGCLSCQKGKKCKGTYHENDICDIWCVGSHKIMNSWKTVYTGIEKYYTSIQQQSKKLEELKANSDIQITDYSSENEVHVYIPKHLEMFIENDIHCYYPEKIMRVLFKDTQVVESTKSKFYWD